MNERDAIELAVFDDEAQPFSPVAADPRPAGRPRPDPASQAPVDSLALVVVDSEANSGTTADLGTTPKRPTLAFDLGLFDPKTAAFVLVYAAGTPLDALQPRTLSVPPREAGSPITELGVFARTPDEGKTVAVLRLQFPQDVGGQQLTVRLTDPADPCSLWIECGPGRCLVSPWPAPAAGRPS
jgi:hypothetical protein